MSDSFDADSAPSTGGDSFSETSTEGWGSRLGGSLIAALIGFILVPAAIVLMYWNEGRAVDAIRALNRGASAIVEVNANAIDPGANGKLVHVSGMLQPTTPAKDPVFGVTGDLAKKMTFRALYRLEEAGRLGCPIIGVASNQWSQDQLGTAIRQALEHSGQVIDEKVLAQLTQRFTYLQGDITDTGTYDALAAKLQGFSRPLFYLEIPPFLFERVVAGLGHAGLTERATVMIEARENGRLHTCVLPGKPALRRAPRPPW